MGNLYTDKDCYSKFTTLNGNMPASLLLDTRLSIAEELVPFTPKSIIPQTKLPTILSRPHQPKTNVLNSNQTIISNSRDQITLNTDRKVNDMSQINDEEGHFHDL